MDLKTFVSEALVQIIEGVESARQQIAGKGIGAAVNPGVVTTDSRRKIGPQSKVEFDVAVTVAEQAADASGTKTSAGIGILSVISAKVAAEASDQTAQTSRNEVVSRVKFSVMVAQPADLLETAPPQIPAVRSVV